MSATFKSVRTIPRADGGKVSNSTPAEREREKEETGGVGGGGLS